MTKPLLLAVVIYSISDYYTQVINFYHFCDCFVMILKKIYSLLICYIASMLTHMFNQHILFQHTQVVCHFWGQSIDTQLLAIVMANNIILW